VKKKKMEHKKERRSMRKDEKGFTGLEAAIVLTAFIVVAAVFSYVVLNAGFFTTEKAKEVVHTGVETATSAVVLAGDIIAVESTTTSDTVATLYIPLKLSAGRGSIQVGADSTDSNLTIAYADGLVYSARCEWEGWFVEERSVNDILDYGEKVQLNVTVPTGSLLASSTQATDATFQLEIKPVEGASLSMSKQTPASIEPINVIY